MNRLVYSQARQRLQQAINRQPRRSVVPTELAFAQQQASGVQLAREAFVEVLKGTSYFEGWGDTTQAYVDPNKIVERKTRVAFREMCTLDDSVSFAAALRTLAALSSGWEILKVSDDPMDLKARDLAEASMHHLQGSPNASLLAMKDSLCMAFSLGEQIWGDILTADESEWAGCRFIDKIAWRNAAYIMFKLDQHDNIEPDGVWQMETTEGRSDPIAKIDLANALYQVHAPKDGSPYGTSPSTAAYPWYFFKTGAIRLWGRTMERFGVPIAMGSIPDPKPGTGTKAADADVVKFKTFLKQLRSSLYAVKYDSWKVELTEIKTGTSELFKDALDRCHRGINRAWHIPALVAEVSDSGGGAYALGESHSDTFSWILDSDRDSDEETWQTQFVNRVVKYNLPVRKMPKFKLKSYKREDLEMLAKVATALDQLNYPLSTESLQERFPDFPLAKDDDDRLILRKDPAGDPATAGHPGGAGFNKENQKDFSNIILDWASNKLAKPGTAYSFATDVKEELPEVIKKRMKASREADDLADSVGSDFSSAIAENQWGSAAGMAIADAAEILETQVGKGNGGPPQG